MTKLSKQLGVREVPMDAAVRAGLTRYDWPGNVRELRNLIERTLILGRFPAEFREELAIREHRPSTMKPLTRWSAVTFWQCCTRPVAIATRPRDGWGCRERRLTANAQAGTGMTEMSSPSAAGAATSPTKRTRSVRFKLLAIALLPTLVILPLLLGVMMVRWNTKFDALLTSKVSGDLTIAHQYFTPYP